MTERGPSLAEIIGAKLAGLFRIRFCGRPQHRTLPPLIVQPVPRALRPVIAAAPSPPNARLIAAYRDLLRMPV